MQRLESVFLMSEKINPDLGPPGHHLVSQMGRTGWHRLPEPAFHCSMSQLIDICHSPTTDDPGLNEICI